MCGRFSLISNAQDIEQHFRVSQTDEILHSYNVSPSSRIPAIRPENGGRVLARLHWGLVPHWAKDTKTRPINARAETIASKPFFRNAFKKHRCLIPANGFYEWKRNNGRKQPYYFRLQDNEIIAFAGLWERHEQDDNVLESCTIITTTANETMKPVHDRMPVILKPDDYDAWLQEGGTSLLQPYAGAMQSWPVSTMVNNPENDGKDLVEPAIL